MPHFFTGGAAGVFGNATGGRRGAIAGAFVNGLLLTFLPAFLLKVLGDFGSANTTFGDTDFGWFGILIGYGARPGLVVGSIILGGIGLALLITAILVHQKLVDQPWDPAPARGAPTREASTSPPVEDAAENSAKDPAKDSGAYPRIAPPPGAPKPPAA